MFKQMIITASLLGMLLPLSSPARALEPEPAVTTADWLNFRSEPSMTGRVLDLIPLGTEINVLDDLGDWCRIEWNGVTGYVYTQYLKQEPDEPAASEPDEPAEAPEEEIFGILLGSEVPFRRENALNSSVYGYFDRGIIVRVLEKTTQWTKVEYDEKVGYVVSQFIRIAEPTEAELKASESALYVAVYSTPEEAHEAALNKVKSASQTPAQTNTNTQTASQTPAQTSTNTQTAPQTPAQTNTNTQTAPQTPAQTNTNTQTAPQTPAQTSTNTQTAPQTPAQTVSTKRSAIVATAKSCLGVPYLYGGADMKGFDCSGLVSYVFAQNGVSLNRTATAQYTQGKSVSKSELLPGDLVFFTNEDSYPDIGHVGIYIGDGKLIHASYSQWRIVTVELNSSWFVRNYYGARRILN